MNWVEMIGYLASLIVLYSFTIKEIKKLRIINIVGCCLFIIYGVYLNFSIPIIVTNMSIIGVHVYHLWNFKKHQP